MRDNYITILTLACVSALVSLGFGVVGAMGDDVALFIHFMMAGVTALLTVVGFIFMFLKG